MSGVWTHEAIHRCQSFVRDRKANPFRFADDALAPNQPHWPPECRPAKGDRAMALIANTKPSRADPVYGGKGPLRMLWY